MRLSTSNYRLVPAYNVLQDQYRFFCGDQCSAILRAHRTGYPPFQLVSDVDLGTIVSVELITVCSNSTEDSYPVDWTTTAVRLVIDIDSDEVDEYVYTFFGGLGAPVHAGEYYVKVTLSEGAIIYGETFFHDEVSQPSCNSRWNLNWSHSCDDKKLGVYSNGFGNVLEMCDVMMFRDGEIKNEITKKDGYGYETNVATDVRPIWSFEVLGNSWLLDSLAFLDQYDTVTLTRSENNDIYVLRDIKVVPKGSADDCFFPIRISFTKDIIATTKCCDSVYEQAPVPADCAGMHVMTSEDFTICSGDSAELTATVIGGADPFIYVWSTGEIDQTITVAPTETTTYVITVIDAFGCTKQDTVTITIVECSGELEGTITPDPAAVICAGESVDLDLEVTGGSGIYTYLWSTGATTQDITVTPSATTIYSVQVTDTITMDVQMFYITITVEQLPIVGIINNECNLSLWIVSSCDGDIAYQWQIESSPGVWDPAPGTNNGTTYLGVNGSNYRLQVCCDSPGAESACCGVSNEIEVTCSEECQASIDEMSYADGIITLTHSTVGTFVSGYIMLYESVDPYNGSSCIGVPYQFVITITCFAGTETFYIPYTPNHPQACTHAILVINGGECTDEEYLEIG